MGEKKKKKKMAESLRRKVVLIWVRREIEMVQVLEMRKER